MSGPTLTDPARIRQRRAGCRLPLVNFVIESTDGCAEGLSRQACDGLDLAEVQELDGIAAVNLLLNGFR
jgi:hypothetical protein